jgi:predicted transcriptional regulator
MFEDFKVRCSAISKVLSKSQANPCLTDNQAKELEDLEKKDKLTEKQRERVAELMVKKDNSTKVILSDTCTSYLLEVYAWETAQKFSITKEMDVEQLQRGNISEPESIELLSFVDNVLYVKNTERVNNDFLTGEPDIFVGEVIMQAKKITDVKSIWDYPGFLCKTRLKEADPANDWQVKGYMDITGAQAGEVANCLVNLPESIVNDYMRRLLYKMDVATDENPEYKRAAAILAHSMRFDDIPAHQRVHKIPVIPMTEFEKQFLYDRVKVCREWLNKYHEERLKVNL